MLNKKFGTFKVLTNFYLVCKHFVHVHKTFDIVIYYNVCMILSIFLCDNEIVLLVVVKV